MSIWIVEKYGTGYTIKNESSLKYISYSGTGNSAAQSDAQNSNSTMNFLPNNDNTYKIQSQSTTSRYLQYNASAKRWAFYANTLSDPALYKLGYTPTTITSVSLNKTSATLNSSAPNTGANANKTVQLTATVTGTGDVSQDVTWTSSDPTIATVSSTGLVTAVDNVKNNTTVTITAESSQDSTKSATCSITVNAATTISITEKPTQLLEGGKTGTITTNITTGWDSSSNTANDISWTSGNSSILRVAGNGSTANLTTGNVDTDTPVTITATLPNGNLASCDILVKKSAPSTIAFNDSSTSSLTSGGEGTLSVTITQGTDFDSQSVTWKSNNSAIKISNGTNSGATITAGTVNSNTTVTITAILTNGNKATWEVTVTPATSTVTKTLTFISSDNAKSDSGTELTVDDALYSIDDDNGIIKSISSISKVYQGKSGYGFKFGSGSATGSMEMTIVSSNIKSMTITTAKYSKDTGNITVTFSDGKNTEVATITPSDGTTKYTLTTLNTVSSIIIATTEKRAYVISISFVIAQ